MRIVAATISIAAILLALAFIAGYVDTVIGLTIYLTNTLRNATRPFGVNPDDVWPPVAGQVDALIAGAGLLIAALLVAAVAVTYAHTRRR